MIKIGWIGCGRHARQMLLPQLAPNGFQLAALCDRDPAVLQRTAAEYGVTALTADYEELIATGNLDAIGMAVGPQLHHRAALKALARGLPVFMEKPPAATAADAQEVAHASETAGKPVVVGFMKRYSTGNRMAHNVLTSGTVGPVLGITASYMTAPTYFVGEVDYSAFYLHHCVHYMDLIPWFTGEDFGDIVVRAVSRAPGRLLLHVNFTTAGGIVGNIVMGTVQSRGTPMEEVRIMSDHARLHIDNVINLTLYRDPPFKYGDAAATLDPASDTLSWTPNFTAAANEDHKGYAALVADTAAMFATGKSAAPLIVDGVRAMERLEQVVRQVRV